MFDTVIWFDKPQRVWVRDIALWPDNRPSPNHVWAQIDADAPFRWFVKA